MALLLCPLQCWSNFSGCYWCCCYCYYNLLLVMATAKWQSLQRNANRNWQSWQMIINNLMILSFIYVHAFLLFPLYTFFSSFFHLFMLVITKCKVQHPLYCIINFPTYTFLYWHMYLYIYILMYACVSTNIWMFALDRQCTSNLFN